MPRLELEVDHDRGEEEEEEEEAEERRRNREGHLFGALHLVEGACVPRLDNAFFNGQRLE